MNDFASKLPEFAATRSKDFPAFLIIICGWDDCPGTLASRPFLVSEQEWMRPVRRRDRLGREYRITGRSCPYCMRVSRLPARAAIR